MKAGANSGKKQRLKLKVARTTQRSSSSRTPSDTATIQAQPAHDFRLKGVPTDLFTVFHVREAAYEVDKRIIASRQPLTRRSLQVDEAQLYQEVLDIPTRPAWTPALKAKRLHELEEASFEAYLTSLYALYPPTRLNHFEHNLQVWRQLWRACEMSDVLLLTADARHPLFHFPPSLYRHITRTLRKPLLLVLNKVDLVDARTLKGWVGWFERRYPELEVVCFSSYPQGEGVVGEEVDVAVKRKERKREGAGGKRQPAAGVREVMAVLERRLREKLAKEGAEATQDRVEERKEDHDVGTDATAAAPTPPTARRSRARTREKAPVALDGEAEEEEGEDTATKAWPEREEAKESAQNAGQGETSLPAALPDAVDAAAPVTAHRSSRRMARLAAASTETSTATDTSLSDLSAAAAGEEVEDEADEHSDEDELVTLHAPAPAKPSRSSILIVGVIGHPNAGKVSFCPPWHHRNLSISSPHPSLTALGSLFSVFADQCSVRPLRGVCFRDARPHEAPADAGAHPPYRHRGRAWPRVPRSGHAARAAGAVRHLPHLAASRAVHSHCIPRREGATGDHLRAQEAEGRRHERRESGWEEE